MSARAGASQYQQQDTTLNSIAKKSGAHTVTTSSTSSKSKNVMSPTSTVVEKSRLSPLSRDDSWGSINNAITRDQEFVQDVERDAQPVRSIFDDGIHRSTTVTTKIWVAHTPSESPFRSSQSTSPSRDHKPHIPNHEPSISHSLDRRTASHEKGLTSPYRHANSITSPQSDILTYHEQPDHLSREVSRNGSEDSIFVLEGPRESDDDEQSMLERGRTQEQRQRELEEFEMIDLEMDTARSATFGERDASRSQSRSGSLGARGRVPVSVFNRNPPTQ